jgi:ribosomal protein L37E
VVIGVGVLTFHLIRKRRAERSTPAAGDRLKAFIDAYPDHAAPPPEPEPIVAWCRRCGKALEPGGVTCPACGLLCPFCHSSTSGLAGRETHHIECPRCGDYWITKSLYDEMLISGRGMRPISWWGGRFTPEDTSEADPFCERDLELLADGWGPDRVLEFKRRRRDST